ncbi:AraC family transcriptional regulator [Roseibaca sp. Y0-43]|uniref:AraC family transcriptional regulator n=1 Tax=Roseibaca sp. Y0-43 TaxID=2816854 RepID=UPI001D0C3796|nr:AraC family transcriptional regulator [Roseibaca sp. Y0-43]MCC1482932.1 AraC family transcriptional regulator ligand-binding domain-containing protein [Roseibaca sp. Y0-43]
MEDKVPISGVLDFFEHAARLTGDDLIGLKLGAECDARDFGLVSFIGIYSDTLGDGLRNMARYMALTGNALSLDVSGLDTTGRVIFDWAVPPHERRRQYVECVLACTITGISNVMHRTMRPRAINFAHIRSRTRPEFLRILGCQPEFGAGCDALEYTAHDLASILPSHDHKLMAFLMEVADHRMEQRPANEPKILKDVETAILRQIGRGSPRIKDVANDLAMSPRSLARRLQDQGTSFSEVLKQLRASLATDYLRESGLSQAQISLLLGFADQSAFSNAFKSWTGKSPGAVKRKPYETL